MCMGLIILVIANVLLLFLNGFVWLNAEYKLKRLTHEKSKYKVLFLNEVMAIFKDVNFGDLKYPFDNEILILLNDKFTKFNNLIEEKLIEIFNEDSTFDNIKNNNKIN